MNYLAGNVNSPIPIPNGYPRDIISGEGPYVIDKNGKKYIDLWMGYGALIFGHADKDITKIISESMEKGWFFSYQTSIEKDVAKILHEIIPSAERVRFATTGSDAVAYALRLARTFTGRNKVLGIKGGYHGVHENMMPGKGTIFSISPDLIPFNDISAVEEKLKTKEHACFILEPILANCGCTPPKDGYLERIRKICSDTGTVLIFDEIVNGFRIDIGGAQKFYNVTPDISTFSKAIAGGLPLSVICGKKEIMENFAPMGSVFFANTFNGSPLALSVAKTVIGKLRDGSLYKKNNEIGESFRKFLQEQIKRLEITAAVQGVGSMSTLAFGCKSFEKGIVFEKYDTKTYNLFIEKMAHKNVLFPPLPTETIFLSPVHEDVMDEIKKAIKESLEELKKEV